MEKLMKRQISKNKQIYLLLKRQISDGVYPPGYRLPPEMELLEQFAVSRNTLRMALQKLENDHLITRIRSKGTFVMPYYDNDDSQAHLLVLCNLDDNYCRPCHYILPGMVREATIRNIELKICDTCAFRNFTPERFKQYLDHARISGIIVIASDFSSDNRLLQLLNTQQLPILLVHGLLKDHSVTNWRMLYCQTKNWWQAGLQHLAGCGHKDVVTTCFANPAGEIRGWLRGEYIDLLKNTGLNPCEKLIVDFPPYDHDALKKKLFDLFSTVRPRPTAVMAYSDHQAPFIYEVLNSLQLKIPEDVAVMGFGNVPNCEYMDPPLSSVDMKYQQMGSHAITLMADAVDRINNGRPDDLPPLVEHLPALIFRESTRGKIN